MYYLLSLLAVGGVYYFYTQRSLITLDERVKNAISQIGVQQNTRWDAITEIAKLIGKYSPKEHDELIRAIDSNRGNIKMLNDAQNQLQVFGEITEKVSSVIGQIHDVQSSELIVNAIKKLNDYDDNVRMSQQIYNDIATRMNSKLRQWPNSIIAKNLGLEPYEYLTVDYSKIELPDVL